MAHSMRSLAREIFLHALAEADIRKAFDRHVQYDHGVLRVSDDLHDLKSYGRVFVASFGKAAHRMAEVLSRQVGPTVEGIIADPNRHPYQLAGYRYFQGGHPHRSGNGSAAESVGSHSSHPISNRLPALVLMASLAVRSSVRESWSAGYSV